MNRWSPPSFDGEPATSELNLGQASVRHMDEVNMVLPSVNEVDAIRGKAYQDAYARGLQEGLTEAKQRAQPKAAKKAWSKAAQKAFNWATNKAIKAASKI